MGLRMLVFLCVLGAILLIFTALILYAKFRKHAVLTAAAGNFCFAGAGILICLSLMLSCFA